MIKSRLITLLTFLLFSVFNTPLWAQQNPLDIDIQFNHRVDDRGYLKFKVDGKPYRVKQPELSEDPFSGYSASEARVLKKHFRKNMREILAVLAKSLDSIRLGLGTTYVINQNISFKKAENNYLSLKQFASRMPLGVQADILALGEKNFLTLQQKAQEEAELTLSQKGSIIIQQILDSVYQNLWKQAPMIAKANEFGFIASVAPQFLFGSGKSGFGGLFEIGINIGYNSDTKSLFIEVFKNIESFESTLLKAVASTGVIFKTGGFVRNQASLDSRENLINSSKAGISFYPPMIPGFSSWSSEAFSIGASSGLTLPPSPFGDALTYQTKTHTESLLKLNISMNFPFIINIQSPWAIKNAIAFKNGFKQIYRSLTKSCRHTFL